MGSALSTFVGAIGSVKELIRVMVKMCDVFNKPRDHDGMSNAPKVGQNRDRLIKEAQQQMGMDAVHDYNFIFCGPTKVGKSTLINAIRGVKPNDKDAAQVGISEVTQDVRCYEYLGLPRVKLYDAPGAGTRSHPAATYFMDKSLYAFDCTFLMYDGSFLECCRHILEEAHKWGKPVAFLRTKADRLLDDVMYNSGVDDEQLAKHGCMRKYKTPFNSRLWPITALTTCS
jgi:GTP-binding protein EngB required for normal cell division